MQVFRQGHHGVDFKWVFSLDMAKSVAQSIDMLHQQALAPISQRHRKKVAAALDEITSVIGHGLMELFGF